MTEEKPLRIILFEDAGVNNLQPLTLTRPAFDLRCGAVSLMERQARILPAPIHAALVRPEQADLCRMHHPHLKVNELDGDNEPVLLVNARWLAPSDPMTAPDSGEIGLLADQVAYAMVPARRRVSCHCRV